MKFKLTTNTKTFFGKKLFQIQATTSFCNIKEGDLGGYVESEKNLARYGNAWVSGDAMVFGDARVSGNARVSGDAMVFGDAEVSGNAWVYGDAEVSGNARVFGDAKKTPKVLSGFPFTVTITDEMVRVGCEYHDIEKWGKNGKKIIRSHGYSKEEAERWEKIILLIAKEHIEE